MKKYIAVLFLYLSFVTPLISQLDKEISLQGILTNEGGSAIPDGTYDITFSIYDVSTNGSSIWTELQSVSVTKGEFSVMLGSSSDLNISFDEQYWVGITIGEGSELNPRIKLSSSPYAIYALTVPENSINSYHIQTGGVGGHNINQMGASTGQALKWNGTQWAPADDQSGGFDLPYYGFVNSLNTAFVVENQNTGAAIAGANSDGNYGYIGSANGVYGYHGASSNSGYIGSTDYGVFGKYNAMNNWGALGNSLNGVVGRKDSENDGAGVFGMNTNNSDITIYNPNKKAGVIGLDYPSYNVGYLGGLSHGAYGEFYVNGNYGYLGGFNYGAYAENGDNGNYAYLAGGNYPVYAQNQDEGNYVFLAGDYHAIFALNMNSGSGIVGATSNDYSLLFYPGERAGVYGFNYEYNNSGYLASDNYGAYGIHSTGNYGYLGSNSYGAYGRHTQGNYGYFGSNSYGAFASHSQGNYAYLASNIYSIYGYNVTNDSYGYIGGSFNGVVGYNGNSNYGSLGNLNHGAYGFSNFYNTEGYLGGRFGVRGDDIDTDNFGFLASSYAGVYGSNNYSGPGVFGIVSDGYTGIYSTSTRAGVFGLDYDSGNRGYLGGSSYGVYGRYTYNGNYGYLGGSSYGVYGQNVTSWNFGSLGTANAGVYGEATESLNYGVRGENSLNDTYGYLGGSVRGVEGYYNNLNWGYIGGDGVGVFGYNYSTSGKAIYGINTIGWAGYFSGDVYVSYDVGIGTTSPSYDLHVVGNAAKTSGSYWTSLSDGRLKDVKSEYLRGIEEISKLNPIVFSFKKDNPLEVPSEEEFVGIIAQDLQDIFPEALSEYGDGYLAFNADPIFWALINAVKQQQEQIKTYEEKYQQQQHQIDELIKMYTDLLERIDK